ncbi:MAG: PEP-CTERM sorting domain-containing protein [Colwellia sp.]|nr:PEP-CTERM sorting domain-containing protein [Colwellia sp.]
MNLIKSLAIVFLLLASTANAGLITDNGLITELGERDLYNFSVTANGLVTINVTETTVGDDFGTGPSFDDFDSYIALFMGTNVFDNTTFIAQNDDGGSGLESLLALSLDSGDYTLAIFTHGQDWDAGDNSFDISHVHSYTDYNLSIRGDVTTVPEPSTLIVFAMGILGLARLLKK